jgi:ACS family allantoate permease-like MFS transporter
MESKQWKKEQAWEALTDPKSWCMVALPFLTIIPNACVSTFSPIVLTGLGYTGRRSLLLTLPQGACGAVWVIGLGYAQERWRNTRAIAYTITIVPVIVLSALLWRLPDDDLAGRVRSSACVVSD